MISKQRTERCCVQARPPLYTLGSVKAYQSCAIKPLSAVALGDGAGKGPINFNTSMHRRSRRIKRRAEIKHGAGHCSFCLGKEQLVL